MSKPAASPNARGADHTGDDASSEQIRNRLRFIFARLTPALQLATQSEDAKPRSDELAAESTVDRDRDDAADDDIEDADVHSTDEPSPITDGPPSRRLALVIGLVTVVALAGVLGWSGIRTYAASQAERDRTLFLDTGREGAVQLTTIDHTAVEADVARILDLSTGTFREDFQSRSQPFVEMVRQVQSTTQGTVTQAGLESVREDQADVLVTVSVKTSLAGAESQPRLWRMRIGVQKIGHDAKVSNVEFVP